MVHTRLGLAAAAVSIAAIPAAASVTVLVTPTGAPTPRGAYIQVDLQNCAVPTLARTGSTVPLSRQFPLNGATSIPVTVEDNVTQVWCSGQQLSYYTFSYVAQGVTTAIKSVELPPGNFALANLAPLTSPPVSAGVIQGPPGRDGAGVAPGSVTNSLLATPNTTINGVVVPLGANATIPPNIAPSSVTNSLLANPGFTFNSQQLLLGGQYSLTATLPGPVSAASTTSAGAVQESKGAAGSWDTPGFASNRMAATYSAPGQGSILGDGSFDYSAQAMADVTLGRNVGLGSNLNNGVYLRSVSAQAMYQSFATPGITDPFTRFSSKTAPGDFGGERNYWNTICADTGYSDEACKFHYDKLAPVRSYTATIASVITPATEIMTTQADNCGFDGGGDTNCSGGQRWLINKTATAPYTGTVTAMTFPSPTAPGTMTLSGSPNLTPTVTATIPAGVPDTTNALLGDTIQVTIANASGTVPASGPYCINGPLSHEVDCGTYTASGTTLTITGHRWPHSNSNGAPMIFFATPRQAVFALDQTYSSADIGHNVLGNASANSVYWTDIGGGARTGGNLQQFATAYTASGTNAMTLYDAALTVTVEDPAKAAQKPVTQQYATAYNLANPGANLQPNFAPSHDGYMRLAYNIMRLNVGDTVSQVLPPSTSLYGQEYNFQPSQYSGNNQIQGIEVNENIPNIYHIGLSNPHNRTVAGTGIRPVPNIIAIGSYGEPTQVGSFNTLMYAGFAPKTGLLITQGCQGGVNVYTSGCPNDNEWAIYSDNRTGEGYYYNENDNSNVYGHIGHYAREAWQFKHWQSFNGVAGLVWPQGMTYGFLGCPLVPNVYNNAIGMTLGNSQTSGLPCSLTMAGSLRTGVAANTDRAGQLTLASGTASYAFTETYTSAPICTASDVTAVAAVQAVATTTKVTINGTGTDTVNYICMGRN